MLVTPYFYPKVGGLENYALNIALGLKELGNDVFIVTTNNDSNRQLREEVMGLRVIRLPILIKLSNTPYNPLWRFQLRKIIALEKPDVINAHTPVPYISDMSVRASGQTPTVLTYHNDLVKPDGVGKYLAKLFYFIYINKTLKKASRIIATSEYYREKSAYLTHYKPKISIAYPGIDDKLFNTKVDKQWLKEKYPNKEVVLFVSSMDKTHSHKGLEILIQAISYVKKAIPNVHLVAVGKGNAIPSYIALAKSLGLYDIVSFPGFAKTNDLPKYYAGASVFVLPSTTEAEGFGMVLAEAQACGTAVIGSNIGGIPFVIKDKVTGTLVAPGSVKELSKAIEFALSHNPKIANSVKLAAKHVRQYAWRHQVSSTNAILHEVIR